MYINYNTNVEYTEYMQKFTEKVLKIVTSMPKGRVMTYKEVAHKAGNILASRAVGIIMSQNKLFKDIHLLINQITFPAFS